jgi:hypothetical protein
MMKTQIVMKAQLTLTDEQKRRMRLWVQGLLSDEFQQGTGRLASREIPFDGVPHAIMGPWLHCCLGVACEIAIRNGLELDVKDIKLPTCEEEIREYEGSSDFLPGRVAQWYGLKDSNPVLKAAEFSAHSGLEVVIEARASALNDGEDEAAGAAFTYAQIAAAIVRTFDLEEPDAETT